MPSGITLFSEVFFSRELQYFPFMRKLFLLVLLVLFSGWGEQLIAQDQTRADWGLQLFQEQTPMLIVPFEPKMLISDLHPPMCKQNGLGDEELIRELQALLVESFSAVEGVSVRNDGDLSSKLPHLGYRYLPVPGNEEKTTSTSEKKRHPFARNTGVQGGEVRTSRNKTPHYMKPVVEPEDLVFLFEESSSEVLCLISELDFKVDHYTTVAPGEQRYKTIALHFALYDREGRELHSGLVSVKTNTVDYNLAHLKNEYLVPLCQEIMVQLKNVQSSSSSEEERNSTEETENTGTSGTKKTLKNKAKKVREKEDATLDEDF